MYPLLYQARCVLWYHETKDVDKVQQNFMNKYPIDPPPAASILGWYENFKDKGSVSNTCIKLSGLKERAQCVLWFHDTKSEFKTNKQKAYEVKTLFRDEYKDAPVPESDRIEDWYKQFNKNGRFIDWKMYYFKVVSNIFGILLYVADILSDVHLDISLFSDNRIVWGSLTTFFTMFPLIISTISVLYGVKSSKQRFGILGSGIILLLCCCTLTLPFVLMVYGVMDLVKGRDNNRGLSGQGMMLLETLLEAFPQSCLQMYIVFQILHMGGTIGPWQWTTLCISLINLSFSISTSVLFEDKPITSKVVFFFFGLITLVSRLLVCSLFSVIYKPLWFVPFGSVMIFSVLLFLIKEMCTCGSDILKWGVIILAWPVTAIFNSFTASGIPIAVINFGLAVASFFLVPATAAMYIACIVATTLSTVNVMANIVLTLISPLRCIGEDWSSKML